GAIAVDELTPLDRPFGIRHGRLLADAGRSCTASLPNRMLAPPSKARRCRVLGAARGFLPQPRASHHFSRGSLRAFDAEGRLDSDREVERIRDETFVVSRLVQSLRQIGIGAAGERNMRVQYDLGEASGAAGRFGQNAGRCFVSAYNDTGIGAQMQVPEHVAGR